MWRRAVPDPSRPLLSSHVRGEQGHLMAGVLQAILDSPGPDARGGSDRSPAKKHHQRLNEDRKSIEKQELTSEKEKKTEDLKLRAES